MGDGGVECGFRLCRVFSIILIILYLSRSIEFLHEFLNIKMNRRLIC